MKGHFVSRAFPPQLVDNCIDRALANHCQQKLPALIEPIPLILTFDPAFLEEMSTLREDSTWLNQDQIGKTLLKEYRPMICYRRPKNPRDVLVRTNVSPRRRTLNGDGTCGKRCYNCKWMIKCNSIKSTSRNYEFPIWGNLDCTSYNVTYLIQCNRCTIQYIGQTSNSVASCLTAHIADIKHNKPTTIA